MLHILQEAQLRDRVSTVGGNAMQQWPNTGADVVLMSYLLSALHKDDTKLMLKKAWDVLPPGKILASSLFTFSLLQI